jgi:hypothetical protein
LALTGGAGRPYAVQQLKANQLGALVDGTVDFDPNPDIGRFGE